MKVIRFEAGSFQEIERDCVTEAPVALTVNGSGLGTIMVSPEQLREFAAGLLYLEGMIEGSDQLESVVVAGNSVNVTARVSKALEECKFRTSAINQDIQIAREVGSIEEPAPLVPAQVTDLVRRLNADSSRYRETGGIHSSGLLCPDGSFLVAEDVGRHNTIDKITGCCLLEGMAFTGGTLVVSGRITLEMVHKAMRLKVPIIISRTSPTDAAVRLADAAQMTLIGYVRGNSFNIYSHSHRVLTDTQSDT